MAKPEKILLLDANALIHRSYHALPPLTTPKGEQVNAVYGFANALLKAINDEKPSYVVACFDSGRHTFRNDLFEGYKAHRKESDEALYSQIPRVKQIVEVLNIPLFAQQGVEADDLIGSLTKIAARNSLKSVIVTGDNDALQLVNDSTSVYSLRRGVTDTLTYNREKVYEKLGIFPEQVVDYKALSGDASDNIPGAPGIGPKTAVDLLRKYGNLEGIYEHIEEVKERQRLILTDNKEQVMMSQQLAQIKCDLDIDLQLEEAAIENFDFSKVVQLFQELDFRSLLSKLPKPNLTQAALLSFTDEKAPAPVEQELLPQLPFEAVTNVDRLREVALLLESKDQIVIDTETVDLEGELIGLALAWSESEAVYVPVSPGYPSGLPLEEISSVLEKVLTGEALKIGHNLKYDLEVLSRVGIEVKGDFFDTLVASQLVKTQTYSHKLDDIALTELGFKKISITQLIGPKKKESMATVPLEKLAAYSCEDVLVTWKLYRHFWKDLEEPGLKRIFYEIEMPLIPVLLSMEAYGIKLDVPYLEKLGSELNKNLKEIEELIYKECGLEFNISSPLQLQKVLFETLKLPVVGIKKVQSGYSTDIDSLQRLIGKHPVIKLVMTYRELSKLMSTYIETLPKLADRQGRVHTTYTQIGAATGRLSSNNPNLQNIPIRTELGNQVRRAFVAAEGRVLLGADYSQAELRVLAHLSEDADLIEAFHTNSDFHAAVAKQLGVERYAAKAINFGIIYGLGSTALAADLNISTTEARSFIDKYFQTFPGVSKYIESMKQQAREQGYVSTIFGRRRYLPDIHSPNMGLRSGAERMAVNMPCQGTVADLMKISMIRIGGQLKGGTKMLLQIHDELLFELKKDEVEAVSKLVRQVMGSVVELKVPMMVDVKVGPNWADLKGL